MGRLKDLVSKVKEEVAPIASVVRDEVAQKMEKVVDRVLAGPGRPQTATAGAAHDEWAFTPTARTAPAAGGSASEAKTTPTDTANGAAPSDPAATSATGGAPAPNVVPPVPGDGQASSGNGAAANSAANGATNGAADNGAANASGDGAAATNGAATAPAQPVKINAQPSPTDPNVCKFTIEVPIFEERLIRVRSRELATEHSPLAAKIFEIPQIVGVTFSGNVITVTKKGPEPWQMIARQIGPAIRAHIASGQPALTSEIPADPVTSTDSEELRARVQHVIDTLINPGVAGHGGYVTLLGVEGDIAYVRMGGGCQGCGMADLTLKQGIVSTIRSQVPEIAQVLDETDHAAGENPFFASGAP